MSALFIKIVVFEGVVNSIGHRQIFPKPYVDAIEIKLVLKMVDEH